MSENSKVVAFQGKKKEREESLRREYERVLFGRILGCYTFIEKLGLKPVEMKDISRSGVSFWMDAFDGSFSEGEKIDFRFYFSGSTYIPIQVEIRRKIETLSETGKKGWSYGAEFDRAFSTYSTLEKFISFVEAYGTVAREDKGDKQLWFL